MRKSTFLSAVTIASLLALPVAAQAEQGREGQTRREGRMRPGQGGMPGGPMALRHLQLTAAQRTEIRAAMQQHRQTHGARFEELRSLRRELRQALAAEAPDLGRVEVLKQQIAASVAQTVPAQIDLQVQIAGILTAEQRQKLVDMDQRGRTGFGRRGRGVDRR
jgi:Spy/CpxP family protein refolding chaperone